MKMPLMPMTFTFTNGEGEGRLSSKTTITMSVVTIGAPGPAYIKGIGKAFADTVDRIMMPHESDENFQDPSQFPNFDSDESGFETMFFGSKEELNNSDIPQEIKDKINQMMQKGREDPDEQ